MGHTARSLGLALAVGTTLLDSNFPPGAARIEVETPYGNVDLLDAGSFLVLQRHGLDRYHAPHAIDHRANLTALAESSVDRILAISSTGSLHEEIAPGSWLAPDDFVAPDLGLSFFEDRRGHLIPVLDTDWRRAMLECLNGAGLPVADGGVYRQTPGPRFETAAEVRMLAQHADVVGMTMASECVLAAELGIAYAAACSVDNYANGVGEAPLTRERFEAGVAATQAQLLPCLQLALPELLAWA